MKEEITMTEAIVLTVAAWFAGLVADANVLDGFLMLRVLLPILAMGGCILSAVKAKNGPGDDGKAEAEAREAQVEAETGKENEA